ncbi:MAG: heme ABC transporter ATP-binding protein [Thermodesulfobacteriota bacterium]
MDAILSVEQAGYRYGDAWALKDVSLKAFSGEMLGVLGPNGSGKSTLLRIMDGLLEPHEGCVRLDGRLIRDLSRTEVARTVAMVSQESHFQFSFSVMEVVLMGRFPRMGRLQFEEERDWIAARKALQATNALDLADRDIHALSGGERQRVVIARALAQEPSVLLLDEPTSFLDLRHKREIFQLAASLAGDAGLGVVVVSHDLDQASQYCDRLIVLKQGLVVAEGPPRDVLTPETIEAVFDCPVRVDAHPDTGRPRVTMVP